MKHKLLKIFILATILLASCIRDPLCKPHDNIFNNPAHCGTKYMHDQWEHDGACIDPCNAVLFRDPMGPMVLAMRDGDDCVCWLPATSMADPNYNRENQSMNNQGGYARIKGFFSHK